MQKLDGNFLASAVTIQKIIVNNLDNHMVVSINGGYPNSWMVYFMENPMKKLMIWAAHPYFRRPPYG
jgi:hypothetical protein